MSAHSCNELCDLDERFHSIQKYEGESEAWYATKEEMIEFCLKKMGEYYELIQKIKGDKD